MVVPTEHGGWGFTLEPVLLGALVENREHLRVREITLQRMVAVALMLIGIILLVNPMTRKSEGVLAVAGLVTFFGTWIDKGMGMISGGFVPNPLHEVNEYLPTFPEVMITIGVYAVGALVLTIFYKITIGVKEEVRA